MKKILALTLAAVMAAGMSTVAFAADDNNYLRFGTEGQVVVDMNDDGKFLGDGKDKVANFSNGKVDLEEIPGGKKVAIVLKDASGYIDDKDDILVINNAGVIIRMSVKDISIYGRSAQGVKMMNLDEGVQVISIARTEHEEEESQAGEDPAAEERKE